MTTEVGSEPEVKKEPEKSSEEAQAEQQQQLAEQPAEPSESEPSAAAEPQPTPTDSTKPDNTDQQENAEAEPSSPPPSSGQKKEKGISRFLPPWLKRQKSHSQVEPKESSSPTDTPNQTLTEKQEEEEKEEEEAEAAEEQVGKAPEEAEKRQEEAGPKEEGEAVSPVVEQPAETKEVKAEVKEEVKAEEVQAENNSVGSVETQPAKEEKEGTSAEKKGEKGGEEVQESSVLSPLKLGKKMKIVVCHVTLLDGTQFPCEVEKRAKGQYLFFKVCEHLNLLEKDYFGLSFKDNADQRCWLDPTKEIKRQIRNSQWQFAFNVKFYPPDPSQLTEDITRYLLCLQLRQDVSSGRLPCSFVTHALLGSYTLQAELGDYDPEEQRLDSIADFQFAPSQTKELEEKVVELHKSHRGMTPAQADVQFLENAKKLSMYGVDLHHAKDSEGVDIMLGVCANGLLIYKDRLRINRFAWPKILKISYKRSNFYIKIRPGEAEQFESTVGFKLPNHRAAKRVWKVCVEHHTFFRLTNPEQPTKSKFLTLGSKFRYSGRTQAQTRQASTLIDRPAPYFERTSSKRISRSLDGAPVISVSDHGHMLDSARTPGSGENGHDPALELSSDSKSPQVEEEAEPGKGAVAGAVPAELPFETGTDGADSSETKSLEEELTSLFLSKARFTGLAASYSTAAAPAESAVTASSEKGNVHLGTVSSAESRNIDQSAEDKLNSEINGQPEVIEVVEETVVIEEVVKAAKPKSSAPEVSVTVASSATEEVPEVKEEEEKSASSDSESEEEAEFHPQSPSDSAHHIQEEPEEEQEQSQKAPPTNAEPQQDAEPETTDKVEAVVNQQKEEDEKTPGEETVVAPEDAPNGHHVQDGEEALTSLGAVAEEEEELEPCVVNGDASHAETERVPQVICCSEPPVVKTEMVTISDTFAAQKTEIATKEVPIVHTETKTITYEAAQLDGTGDGEPGVLMTAQTITSESLCTTTTTHITKTLKGGLSETRIEKRIVITGDSDIDHDQALAQAIKEAKEQHPDMSVTRVVVHKETELAEDDD
ncbi:band 4.1-like protein 2 isoform X10 [Astyanax mexicanus]|uniref:band 4.1-like protein 2 isoform X10 n=1 Tax=Astyanax mexicanus TaxID=7994 RepID=UPI0020CAE40C|nr:band 4.1-like protein 2 isoform X10 [Astyanax mexicanus]